jgi:hypothetical protein
MVALLMQKLIVFSIRTFDVFSRKEWNLSFLFLLFFHFQKRLKEESRFFKVEFLSY